MKRTLRLRAESLSELTSDELGGVAGAQLRDPSVLSCPILRCVATYPIRECVVIDPPTMPNNCYTFPWC